LIPWIKGAHSALMFLSRLVDRDASGKSVVQRFSVGPVLFMLGGTYNLPVVGPNPAWLTSGTDFLICMQYPFFASCRTLRGG
jgi:hypothetical protein